MSDDEHDKWLRDALVQLYRKLDHIESAIWLIGIALLIATCRNGH